MLRQAHICLNELKNKIFFFPREARNNAYSINRNYKITFFLKTVYKEKPLCYMVIPEHFTRY